MLALLRRVPSTACSFPRSSRPAPARSGRWTRVKW